MGTPWTDEIGPPDGECWDWRMNETKGAFYRGARLGLSINTTRPARLTWWCHAAFAGVLPLTAKLASMSLLLWEDGFARLH